MTKDVRLADIQSIVPQNPVYTYQVAVKDGPSLYGDGFNNGESVDTYGANQNEQTNSNNDIYARDEIKNLFAQYKIDIKKAKAENLIGQVLGKNENGIIFDENTIAQLTKILELEIRTISAKKLELNIENIVNYGNMISTSVASGCESFTLENIELDVIELENDKNKKFLKLEGLTDGNSNDVMSIDEQMAKFYCGELYHIENWNALPRDKQEKYIKKFRNKSIEEKREYIKRFFSGFFKEGAEKLQLDNYVRYINATKDPESRAALIDALEALADENKLGGFKSWITSFKTNKERNIATSVADNETMRNIFNSENVPEEDASEAYRELSEIQNAHTAKKFEKERDEYKKEFFENNSDIIEKIIQILNKKEEDLTDEEKQFLGEHKETVVEYRNIVRGADTGRTIGLINSPRILSDKVRQKLLQHIADTNKELSDNYYKDYITGLVNNHSGINISEDAFEALMNTVTDNTYSEVKKEIVVANSAKNLKEVKNQGDNGLGFSTKEAPSTNPQVEIAQLYNPQTISSQPTNTQNETKEIDTSDFSECSQTIDGYKAFKKGHSFSELLTEVFNSPFAKNYQIADVVRTFKRESSSEQASNLVSLGCFKAIAELLPEATSNCLRLVKDKFNNSFLNNTTKKEMDNRSKYDKNLQKLFG